MCAIGVAVGGFTSSARVARFVSFYDAVAANSFCGACAIFVAMAVGTILFAVVTCFVTEISVFDNAVAAGCGHGAVAREVAMLGFAVIVAVIAGFTGACVEDAVTARRFCAIDVAKDGLFAWVTVFAWVEDAVAAKRCLWCLVFVFFATVFLVVWVVVLWRFTVVRFVLFHVVDTDGVFTDEVVHAVAVGCAAVAFCAWSSLFTSGKTDGERGHYEACR